MMHTKNLPRRRDSGKVLCDNGFTINSIIDFSRDSTQWSANFLTKSLGMQLLTQKQKVFLKTNNQLMNYTSSSLENLRNTTYILL